jgi:hypothetical protein
MPWPTGPVSVGVKGENAALHVWIDGTSEQPKSSQVSGTMPQAVAVPIGNFQEMLLGHRSGGVNKPSAFLSIGSTRYGTGASVTYAAATLTDTFQNWVVNQFGAAGAGEAFGVYTDAGQYNVILSNTATVLTMKSNWATTPGANTGYSIMGVAEQNQGATVSYVAGPANALVDTGKAWIANQWRGRWIYVAGEVRQIVSNTATQITLDRAWGTTPAAQQAYFIADPLPDNWLTTQRGSSSGPLGVSGMGSNGPDMNPNNL